MFLLFVNPGFKQAPSDAHLIARKNELDQQAVGAVAGNQALFGGLPINQSDRIAMADAARQGDRASFDAILHSAVPTMNPVTRSDMYSSFRGNVLAEQQILYRSEYTTAVNNNDPQAASYWVSQSIRNARDSEGYAMGPNFMPLTADELVRMALGSLGNTLTSTAQKEAMLADALEHGASASSVFGAARDLGIDQSPGLMQRLEKAAYDRADRLFTEMKAYHGKDDPVSVMEYNRRLHEFRSLLGQNAMPDQSILSAGSPEQNAFLGNIDQQLRTQAGVP